MNTIQPQQGWNSVIYNNNDGSGGCHAQFKKKGIGNQTHLLAHSHGKFLKFIFRRWKQSERVAIRGWEG